MESIATNDGSFSVGTHHLFSLRPCCDFDSAVCNLFYAYWCTSSCNILLCHLLLFVVRIYFASVHHFSVVYFSKSTFPVLNCPGPVS